MPRPLHEPNIRNPAKIQINIATPVGADLCVGPLREPDIRNPTKTHNNFAIPVGADRCVGPRRTTPSKNPRRNPLRFQRGGWVYASTSTFTTALRVGTGSPAGLPGEWGSSGRKMANCPAVRVKSKPFTFSQGR